MNREEIIEAAKRAAREAGNSLSRSDFERITGIGQYHIYRLFPDGGWSEVKRLAGLTRHPKHNLPLSDEDLLNQFHQVASSLGRVPTWALFASRAPIAAETVSGRFGGLQGTRKRYRNWLLAHEPNSLLLTELDMKSRHEVPAPPVTATTAGPTQPAWTKGEGPEFGAPINFRGLRHAPINEQRVVFLFGMVSYELGFIVEAVHAWYPDCEAKRCIDSKRQRWQRVRIEFEYLSSNFRVHGHDPIGCDVIVCWEHDWPECPLEVVELRRVIDTLAG